MASQIYLWLFLVAFTGIICSVHANRLNVGGKDGWMSNPKEDYVHWTQRLRFTVGDTLFFKYEKGSDSVLVVGKDDYDKCNTDKPIMKMEDGDSVFNLDRPGPFYFISGNKENCDKGQKLTVVVLSTKNSQQPKSPTPSPIPTAPTPVSLTPAAAPPMMSPTSPMTEAPTPSMMTPVSPSPATMAPGVMSPTPSMSSLSPMAEVPTPADMAPAVMSPESSMSPSPMAGGPIPAAMASAFTPPVFLVSLVSLVLSVALGGFITSP